MFLSELWPADAALVQTGDYSMAALPPRCHQLLLIWKIRLYIWVWMCIWFLWHEGKLLQISCLQHFIGIWLYLSHLNHIRRPERSFIDLTSLPSLLLQRPLASCWPAAAPLLSTATRKNSQECASIAVTLTCATAPPGGRWASAHCPLCCCCGGRCEDRDGSPANTPTRH